MQVITMLMSRTKKYHQQNKRYLLDETASATICTSIPFSSRSNVVHWGHKKQRSSLI